MPATPQPGGLANSVHASLVTTPVVSVVGRRSSGAQTCMDVKSASSNLRAALDTVGATSRSGASLKGRHPGSRRITVQPEFMFSGDHGGLDRHV
jgi:hypothetical protein